MKSIVFGGDHHKRLEIEVHGYMAGDKLSGQYDDDNWLEVTVSIACGAFKGKFRASFQTYELASFYRELAQLAKALRGKANFNTLEDQLELTCVGDGTGGIDISGQVMDISGVGNKLIFSFQIDHSQLIQPVRDLEAVIAAFPALMN